IESIDPALLTAVLQAGGWSETADDNGGHERLSSTTVGEMVRGYASRTGAPTQGDIAALGVLVLSLSVAEWGVVWSGDAPQDPARQNWQGPADITQGKHLLSYALGGIGLPHLDSEKAVEFFNALEEKIPEAAADLRAISKNPPGFRYDAVRAKGGVCASDPTVAVIMTDLNGVPFRHSAATFGGRKYCQRFNPSGQIDAESWRRLRHWCRIGLRQRDMQEWILKHWINKTWIPSYNEVMRHPHGTIREALVVARMWNSSSGDAYRALNAASSESDPNRRIAIELRSYGLRSATNESRAGVMQRPVVVYDFITRS
ncbi:MAG: hypothetical protein ACLP9L_31480, partial [Thermoguttaceae bacterium]